MHRKWIPRIIFTLAFGVLTISSVGLEFLEWRVKSHQRAYLAFFGLAGITLVLVIYVALDSTKPSWGGR